MEYLTIEEVCNMFKVSRKTLERWRIKGLPSYKVGSLVRFKLSDLEYWINEHEKKGVMPMNGHKIIIGSVGSGKTTNGILPILNEWNGSALIFNFRNLLSGLSLEKRKSLGQIIEFDFDNESCVEEDITKIIVDSLCDCASVYLSAGDDNSLSRLSPVLDLVLKSLIENNNKPVLIVLDEFVKLNNLINLWDIICKGRARNIYVLISASVQSPEQFKCLLIDKGYDEKTALFITANCTFENMNGKKLHFVFGNSNQFLNNDLVLAETLASKYDKSMTLEQLLAEIKIKFEVNNK